MKLPLKNLFCACIGIFIFSCNETPKKELDSTPKVAVPPEPGSPQLNKEVPETELDNPENAKKKNTATLDTLRPKKA